MNYCRKCQSDYEKPGTCNCFAKPAIVTTQYVPPNGTSEGMQYVSRVLGWRWSQSSCNMAGCTGNCGICTKTA